MNTTKKITPQRSLAHLTEEERHQIYEWLKTETYEAVLARIAKSRDQGGFDTHVSRHVLEVLRQRYALAEALSAHTEERVAVEEMCAIINGEPIPYHNLTLHFVQKAACELAQRKDQSASMLYNLMRIANNPFNCNLATEKLALQKRALELRENSRLQTALKNRPLTYAEQDAITEQHKKDLMKICPDLVRAITAPVTDCGSADCSPSTPTETEQNTAPSPLPVAGAARTEGQDEGAPVHPRSGQEPKSKVENQKSTNPAPLITDHSITDYSKKSSNPLATPPRDPNTPPCPLCAKGEDHLSPEALAKKSDQYTVRRAQEHAVYGRHYSGGRHKYSPPEYISELRECPCGSPLPCEHHDPLPPYFWKCSPSSEFYAAVLEARNIPFREPREFLA